jgi:hypothetical protein
LALLRPRYQSGAVKEKFKIVTKTEKVHRDTSLKTQCHWQDIRDGT